MAGRYCATRPRRSPSARCHPGAAVAATYNRESRGGELAWRLWRNLAGTSPELLPPTRHPMIGDATARPCRGAPGIVADHSGLMGDPYGNTVPHGGSARLAPGPCG